MKITSLGIIRAASYWYPTMLAEAAGEIGESKAAELLGLNIDEYRLRKYDAIEAVKDLTFEVPKGQILGFIGANGAGKTTLISMITGMR